MRIFTPLRWPLTDSNIKTVIRELQVDLLKYISIEATVNGATEIEHKLGRVPLGWFVIDKDADTNIWKVSADTQKITLTSSVSVNIKLLLF
jgi:hypothetical protein